MDCVNGCENTFILMNGIRSENTAILMNGIQSENNKQKVKACATMEDEWIDLLKLKSADWTGKPLVVLSLFDGIGAIWAALSLTGIPFVGYSSEINPYARQIVKERYPDVKCLGDIKNIKKGDINDNVDFIVGGFPCQDLSCMGKKAGLHGDQSKLFFELLRMLQIFQPTWFLVENVASMSWVDRDEISKYLGCLPIEMDSQDLTPTRRRRLFWTNIPHPKSLPKVRDNLSTSLQSVLENAIALQAKTACVLSANHSPGSAGQVQQVLDDKEGNLRSITISELEKIMGFPPGYTDFQFSFTSETQSPKPAKTWSPNSPGKSEKPIKLSDPDGSAITTEKVTKYNIRWRLLGNTFSVKVIVYLLSSLLNRSVRERKVNPIVLPKNIQEQKCSVMEEGDIWALYNTHAQPNWYGFIVKRSGGRFSKSGKNGRNGHIRIEVKFLELTYDYTSGEADKWSPDRGAGKYKMNRDSDIQDNWPIFSHRVRSYYKSQYCYFIYPGKDEVWAVYNRQKTKSSPFFVYVIESSINAHKWESVKPGKEGFKARCYVMQQTSQPELFRLTEKTLEYEDLSCFSFSVPYHFKDEFGVLKIEYSNNNQRAFAERPTERTIKRRRDDFSDDECSDPGGFMQVNYL